VHGDHQGVDTLKLRRTRITVVFAVLALVSSVPLATTALAQASVTASISGDPVAPGQQARLTLEITPEPETTLGSFTLTPPTNWQLVSDDDSPSPGSATEEGEPSYAIDGNTVVGSDLGATSTATVEFDVETPCKGGDGDWTLDAVDSEGNPLGESESSDLSTNVDGNCSALATITGDPLAPGQEGTLHLTIAPSGGTLDSFTLTPPANWELVSDESSPSPGSGTEGPSYTIDGNTLVGSQLGVTSESSASVEFRVQTGCRSGDRDWTFAALDKNGDAYDNSENSDLTTNVDTNCTALATITGDPVAPGREVTLGFSIVPSGGTLDGFSLTPPANWQLVSGGIETSPSPSPGASNFAIQGNKLVGSDLGVTSSSAASVHFRVKTGCKAGNWTWTFAALDKNGDAYDNSLSSDLTTNVSANCTLAFETQPKDAEKNALITGTTFEPSTNFVSVALKNGLAQTVTYFPVDVTFDRASGSGLATGSLSADTKTTVDGVATFSGAAATLSISNPNEPLSTDYKITPKTVGTYAGITGANSTGFDIWGDGCKGPNCDVNLTPGTSSTDTYTTSENVALGASQVNSSGATNISCPTQQLIFSTDLFFHATSGNGPVFLVTHISAADRKLAPNNGNKVMGWCVGIKSKGPWNFRRQNTNGDNVTDPNNGTYVAGSDLWVGMAPKCPSKNASTFAPCITSQTGDGVGGTIIRGWLPGGDPPRRT
jgi:hypothetical protein